MSIPEEVKILIEEEEKILKEVLKSLESQIFTQYSKLDSESRKAKELTSKIVSTRKDEEKQMLASDEAVAHLLQKANREEIKNIKKLIKKPYFARVALEEEINGEIKNIEYKLGFFSNLDCRIIDWRKAPIAKLYYEYNEGDYYEEEIQERERKGKVVLKNKVHIEGSELIRLECSYGVFEKKDSNWIKSTSRYRDSSNRAYNKLPDILSLITKEQFQMITEDAKTAILIQGVAGSGKTTVSLHRLAWLLNENNSKLKETEVLILVIHPILKKYIEDSLPSLEIKNVKVMTFSDFSKKRDKKSS